MPPLEQDKILCNNRGAKMRGMKAKIPRAINSAARMEVADNTGARIVEVISVLKYRGVRNRYPRAGGMRVSFEDNAVVIVDDEGVPKGTEIKGPVAREAAERYSKISSAASIIV